MQDNHWKEFAAVSQPFIDSGRRLIPIKRFPKDLDFEKTIGGTTYIVTSHFKKDAAECMIQKVNRMIFHE